MVTSKRSVCLIVFIVDVLPFLKVLQAEKEHTVIDIDGKIWVQWLDRDIIIIIIIVHNIEDSSDIIGYLTISIDGLHSLRQLVMAEL